MEQRLPVPELLLDKWELPHWKTQVGSSWMDPGLGPQVVVVPPCPGETETTELGPSVRSAYIGGPETVSWLDFMRLHGVAEHAAHVQTALRMKGSISG